MNLKNMKEKLKDALIILITLFIATPIFWIVVLREVHLLDISLKAIYILLLIGGSLFFGLVYFIWNHDKKYIKINQTIRKEKNNRILEEEKYSYLKEERR